MGVWRVIKNKKQQKKKNNLERRFQFKTHKQTQLVGGFNPFEKC